MKISRRNFGAASLASLAFAGYARSGVAAEEGSYRNQVVGYGPLVADPQGYFDLPQGFSYTILSSAGEAMDDGFMAPDHFDGMGCIALGEGRVALVRNHELTFGANGKGATGGNAALEQRIASLPGFGHDGRGQTLPGGTSTVIVDTNAIKRVEQFLSLAGTSTNCAGGVTPWGSWLSCEETVISAPIVEKSHGWVFEVPAAARGLVEPTPLRAMGRFRHEAAAVDPHTGIVYMTEDRDDGLLYRFIPAEPGKLAKGGKLQALAMPDRITDCRNWYAANIARGARYPVRWIDLADVESPDDDLRLRGATAGAALFARGEGIHLGRDGQSRSELFFTCTSGGAGRYGQIFRLSLGTRPADELELFVESTDPRHMDYADNLTIAPWGHLIVCEDRTGSKVNHLKGVTPQGKVYTLARLNAATELAGACFSPDGRILFVNAYSPGKTLAITGPWNTVVAAQT